MTSAQKLNESQRLLHTVWTNSVRFVKTLNAPRCKPPQHRKPEFDSFFAKKKLFYYSSPFQHAHPPTHTKKKCKERTGVFAHTRTHTHTLLYTCSQTRSKTYHTPEITQRLRNGNKNILKKKAHATREGTDSLSWPRSVQSAGEFCHTQRVKRKKKRSTVRKDTGHTPTRSRGHGCTRHCTHKNHLLTICTGQKIYNKTK